MPAQILHTLFGKAVIAEIGTRFGAVSELEKTPEHSWSSFVLGCQGPDIFYHSQMTRPVGLEYGALLHRRGFGDFAAALLKGALSDISPREKGITPLEAYVLGFMTHAILDRFCHPYIVYKSSVIPSSERAERFSQTFPKGTAHAFFERILDVLMLELLHGIPVSSWDQDVLTEVCAKPPSGLRELLFQSLVMVFPERAGKDKKLFQRIDNTMKDCALFYDLTDPQKTSLQSRLPKTKTGSPLRQIPLVYLYPERFPLHLDYLKAGQRTWFYPTAGGPQYTCSFPDIYAAAVKLAVDVLLGLIFPYIETGIFPFEKAVQYLGNGGLSIQDETGKPCAPTLTDALPLDTILLQQKALRLELKMDSCLF